MIHAVTAAKAPIHDAFDRLWPEARLADLDDLDLPGDLADAGELTKAFTDRMAGLIDHGVRAGAHAVLFTCSAFGSVIDAAKSAVDIPVLKPDEAMIEKALSIASSGGGNIGGLATFEPTVSSLSVETALASAWEGLSNVVSIRHVPGALDALNDGREADHNALIAAAAEEMEHVDALLLAQFSMICAKDAIADVPGRTVLTAPDEAVLKLKGLLEG